MYLKFQGNAAQILPPTLFPELFSKLHYEQNGA